MVEGVQQGPVLVGTLLTGPWAPRGRRVVPGGAALGGPP